VALVKGACTEQLGWRENDTNLLARSERISEKHILITGYKLDIADEKENSWWLDVIRSDREERKDECPESRPKLGGNADR